MTKPNYSMPDAVDRTDHEALRGMSDSAINYDDIPRLSDTKAWQPADLDLAGSLHVFPGAKGWTVRIAGAAKPKGVFARKSDAVMAATSMARKSQGSLAVHDQDGSVRLFRSFAATR